MDLRCALLAGIVNRPGVDLQLLRRLLKVKASIAQCEVALAGLVENGLILIEPDIRATRLGAAVETRQPRRRTTKCSSKRLRSLCKKSSTFTEDVANTTRYLRSTPWWVSNIEIMGLYDFSAPYAMSVLMSCDGATSNSSFTLWTCK